MAADPYSVLGISTTASDEELRAAYRRLVKQHHPDHNGGSADSARRFEAVQEAYAAIQRLRADDALRSAAGSARQAAGSARRASSPGHAPSSAHAGAGTRAAPSDPDLEARLADLERQVSEARQARDQANRAAREAAAAAERAAAARRAGEAREGHRPTDEELGYYTTDDSIGKILADAREQLSDRLAHADEHPVVKRVGELIDGLEELTGILDRKPRRRP